MDSVAQYLMRILATAILCAIASGISGSTGAVSTLLRFLSGIIMVVCIIQGFVSVDIKRLSPELHVFSENASAAVLSGENAAEAQLANIIEAQLCAYIQDKADSLNAEVVADITLSDMLPSEVSVCGYVSPYAKAQLSAWITENLNIPREAQHWTSPN